MKLFTILAVALSVVSATVAVSSPTFYLYTPTNPDSADQLQYDSSASITASHFDGSLPTKIFVHGYMDSVARGNWMRYLKDAYLQWEATNVILVDWSKDNRSLYPLAVVNARLIGAMLAKQIEALVRTAGATLDSFHLHGHSLGAHVVGFAGKKLNGKLGRITGLDPAGPSFQGKAPASRLWRSDALFVDVIHTDASKLGMYEACGHVDFYPNGGDSPQPGCAEEQANPSKYSKAPEDELRTKMVCNHARAVDFYLDSVNRSIPLPKAYQCDSFKSFQSGQCTECGSNGEKCALLGVRAIEYAPLKSDSSKRWFLVTDLHRPTLSKYQYDLLFNTSSGASVAASSVGVSSITGFDANGNSATFNFESNALSGTGLTTVSSIDPESLNQISFSGRSIGQVSSIRVIGFTASSSTPESPALVLNFCKSSSGETFEKC